MRRVPLILLTVFLQSRATCQSLTEYMVPGKIPMIKQAKENDCWLTVAAMMMSWKEKTVINVEGLLDRIGDPWKLYYELDTGLPAIDQDAFTKLLKLKSEPPANYTLKAYFDLLKNYGPIWITTGDGISAHARILIGIKGNGKYDDTTRFVLIDPFTGSSVDKDAPSFFKEFEEEARVANEDNWDNFRIQMYHF